MKVNKKNLKKYFEFNVNTQEGTLGTWIIVVSALTTTGLLFYHMSSLKTVVLPRPIAGIFSSGLIIMALFYNIFSLYNFLDRTNYILISTDKNDIFSQKKIRQSQILYGVSTTIVSIIQLLIVITIIYGEYPRIRKLFYY